LPSNRTQWKVLIPGIGFHPGQNLAHRNPKSHLRILETQLK
jgi:hypothetical protein